MVLRKYIPKSAPDIGIHWRHYFQSRSDLMLFSHVKRFNWLGLWESVSDVIGRLFEVERNGYRFEEKWYGFDDWTWIRGWKWIRVLHVYIYIYLIQSQYTSFHKNAPPSKEIYILQREYTSINMLLKRFSNANLPIQVTNAIFRCFYEQL